MDHIGGRSDEGLRPSTKAVAACCAATVIFVAAIAFLPWRVDSELHTIMEVVATLVAAFVGVLALIRFYSKKSNTFLFLGTGFLGTALLDGYHGLVTSSFFDKLYPSPPESLGPWSWNASRTFLAVLMFLSWLAWRWGSQQGDKGRVSERLVYYTTALLTLASFCFFALVPLPRAYYPEFPFARPQEFIAAGFFAAALVGYALKQRRPRQQTHSSRNTSDHMCVTPNEASESFELWLIISLLVAFVSQSFVMSRSAALFDFPFELAHALKIVSYAFVLVGLLIDVYRLFGETELARARLERVNNALAEKAAALKVSEISLRKQTEALRRSNQELEQFAYVASHDLQEPLRKVSAFCTLLEQEYGDRLTGDGQTYIRYAVDGATRMKTLIQDLLTYSRFQTKPVDLADTDMAAALARVLDHLELAIAEAQAEITYDVLPTVLADENQLVHLLQNLIGNAIKYRGAAAPRIHVGVERQDSDWLISVSDNGIGIAPEFHERVFGIFKRLHARDEYSGTGIGLAICERIVNRLGGRIWVDSAEGHGATFYFTVPVSHSDLAEGAPQHEQRRPVYAETY